MKFGRIIAFLLVLATGVAAAFVYLEYVYMPGFPDGFITELERVERMLAYVFIGINCAAGTAFAYLGRTMERPRRGLKLCVVAALYSMAAFCLLMIAAYFASFMDNGAGG